MPQTIPDPPKQPCWAHGLLVCTGRHGELLVGLQLRKPNSFSHSEDRGEGGKWDNVLSALWAQLPCPGTSPLLLKIPGLCHCSLHVPNITIWWSILSSLQCARTRGNASGYVGQRLLWKSLPTWVCDTVLAAEWRKIYPVLAAAIGLTQWH